MKKIIVTVIIVAILVASIFSLTACNKPDSGETIKVNIVVPDGSPALAIAKLVSEKPTYEGYDISYTVVDGAAAISTKLVNGEANVAIAPTNIGATLYNKNGNVRLLTTNVQGSLYMVGTEGVSGTTTAEKLQSLKGKLVYNIGQGATPDLTLKYILSHFGIEYRATTETGADYVALAYVASGSELIPLLKNGNAKYGILGEPAVTAANSKVSGCSTLFSVSELWKEASGTTDGLPQAGMFVKDELLTAENAGFITWLTARLEENTEWVKTNPEAAVNALKTVGSTALNGVTSAMVTACNIKVIKAADAKAGVTAYLTALHGFNAASVGGKVPNDDFYHVA